MTEEQLRAEKRWAEIRFYLLCADVFKIHQETRDIINLVESLSCLSTYSPIRLKETTEEVISTVRIRPNVEEIIILAATHDVPVKDIRKRTGSCNATLYKIIDNAKQNPPAFYPRLTDKKIEDIQKFLRVIDIIKGAGL